MYSPIVCRDPRVARYPTVVQDYFTRADEMCFQRGNDADSLLSPETPPHPHKDHVYGRCLSLPRSTDGPKMLPRRVAGLIPCPTSGLVSLTLSIVTHR